jgi:uncharacterized protein (DUF2141 family)
MDKPRSKDDIISNGEAMKIRFCLPCGILSIGGLLLWMGLTAASSPAAQQEFTTSTPQPNGQITYTVEAGDTCGSIAQKTGVSVEYLRTQNMLDAKCDVWPGLILTIGIVTMPVGTPTPGASPTPQASLTPTLAAGGTGELCVLMFADMNGDGMRESNEMGVAGGAVSVTNLDGNYSQSQTTVAAIDPTTSDAQRTCFDNLSPGTYTISAAVPNGFNPTTSMTTTVEITPGDTSYVNFGAQIKTSPSGSAHKGASPLLGILGALVLLGGIGLAIYAWKGIR